MVDITQKSPTLRYAKAEAIVDTSPEAIQRIEDGTVPKGNVFEMSKAAGLLGIKQTPLLLPDCHPIPIEFSAISYEIEGNSIRIIVEIKTVYTTGVEVEAMHGASITALNIYDMLKPIAPGTSIGKIQLIEKTGGKSDRNYKGDLSCSVVRVGTMIQNGSKEDAAKNIVSTLLAKHGVEMNEYKVVSDSVQEIQSAVKDATTVSGLILIVGGTGPSITDNSMEAIKPMLTKELPGIGEMIRNYGQKRSPFAYLSSSIGGFIDNHVVVAVPSGTKGVDESLNAIFPHIKQAFKTLRDGAC